MAPKPKLRWAISDSKTGVRRLGRLVSALAVAALVLLSFALMTGCNPSSSNDPATGGDDVKQRFELLVSAVTSSDYSAQYELQVPPSKRAVCTEELFLNSIDEYYGANPDALDALVALYEKTEYVSHTASGTDRRIVIAEDTSSGDRFTLEFRREEGQWYFREPAFEGGIGPLSECRPD